MDSFKTTYITLPTFTSSFTHFLIREPKERVLKIRQISESHYTFFFLACIILARLPQRILLPSIRIRQKQSKANQHCKLNTIRNQDSNDARAVNGRFGGLEGERSNDVPSTVGDEKECVDGRSLGGTARICSYEGHAHCE